MNELQIRLAIMQIAAPLAFASVVAQKDSIRAEADSSEEGASVFDGILDEHEKNLNKAVWARFNTFVAGVVSVVTTPGTQFGNINEIVGTLETEAGGQLLKTLGDIAGKAIGGALS